jgi:hypothetical protein
MNCSSPRTTRSVRYAGILLLAACGTPETVGPKQASVGVSAPHLSSSALAEGCDENVLREHVTELDLEAAVQQRRTESFRIAVGDPRTELGECNVQESEEACRTRFANAGVANEIVDVAMEAGQFIRVPFEVDGESVTELFPSLEARDRRRAALEREHEVEVGPFTPVEQRLVMSPSVCVRRTLPHWSGLRPSC